MRVAIQAAGGSSCIEKRQCRGGTIRESPDVEKHFYQRLDMYFGIYQALSTANEEVFRQYRPDFFDLIIIDECRRGAENAA